MKKKTIAALDACIDIWTDRAAGRINGNRSALCERFNLVCRTPKGEKCPIYKKTELDNCAGSPYWSWSACSASSMEAQKSAKQMLKLLKSLRPKTKNRRSLETEADRIATEAYANVDAALSSRGTPSQKKKTKKPKK